MPKYFKAGTNIVGVPKKMVFVDSKGEGHLFPTLTAKKHIASHYGQNAVITDYVKSGNLLKLSKGEYIKHTEKIKKAKSKKMSAEMEAKKAQQEQKRLEREAKKVEKEKKKAERDAKKAERDAKKAERDAKKMVIKEKNTADLKNKLTASVIANDMYHEALGSALATLPKGKRGRPKGSGKKKV
jgi:predicted RNase H-like nuclease (RuvC/YqgF family)